MSFLLSPRSPGIEQRGRKSGQWDKILDPKTLRREKGSILGVNKSPKITNSYYIYSYFSTNYKLILYIIYISHIAYRRDPHHELSILVHLSVTLEVPIAHVSRCN
jgi:hypothetical protein